MNGTEEFKAAQERLLKRVSVVAESLYLEIPAVSGRAHVLVSGEGPPVVFVPGFGDPSTISAPLLDCTTQREPAHRAALTPARALNGSASAVVTTHKAV
jgi:hypothetical protein